jgi:fructokinase
MIVVAGESLIDLLVRPDGSVEAVPGGGPYNTARALGRLRVPTAFIGRLSTDRFGRILRERLLADGVDLRWATDTDDPTLLAIAELDSDGGATYRFHDLGSAAAGLDVANLPAQLPGEVVAVHVGTLGLLLEPMATAVEGLVARVAEDVVVFLDLNVRPTAIRDEPAYRARLDRVMRRADVVKASVDDLAWLTPEHEPGQSAGALLTLGPSVVLVTDGAGPVRAVAHGGAEVLVVPAVTIVDTVGAGDAFSAGFLAWWQRKGARRADLANGAWVRDATRLAVRVGSATTTRAGAEPPTAEELEAIVPA